MHKIKSNRFCIIQQNRQSQLIIITMFLNNSKNMTNKNYSLECNSRRAQQRVRVSTSFTCAARLSSSHISQLLTHCETQNVLQFNDPAHFIIVGFVEFRYQILHIFNATLFCHIKSSILTTCSWVSWKCHKHIERVVNCKGQIRAFHKPLTHVWGLRMNSFTLLFANLNGKSAFNSLGKLRIIKKVIGSQFRWQAVELMPNSLISSTLTGSGRQY